MSLKPVKHFLMKNWARLGRRMFRDHYVFVCTDFERLRQGQCKGAPVQKFVRFTDLPADLLGQITRSLGDGYENTLKILFDQKARLYVATVNGAFGSMGWVQSGRDLTEWWVPIEPDDFVMFSAVTAPEFRGQRLWGRVILAAYDSEIGAGGRYYCDCNVTNIASRRQLERAGFEIISREKALKPNVL